MKKTKQRVAVIFGGRSGEHEISLRSAASVLKNLDRSLFHVLGIGIDKKGIWKWIPNLEETLAKTKESLTIEADWPEVTVSVYPHAPLMVNGKKESVDVFFPVMHGPLCEDGSIQGLFELMDMPYVGCGVLASSVGMDKEVSKRLLHAEGISVVPWLCVKSDEFHNEKNKLTQKVNQKLGFPVFVKPVNMGSSVGVHKVKKESDLLPALEDAFLYDHKVLIEKAISAREIEVSALENEAHAGEPLVSVAGEIIPQHEFYSYEAKYLDENGAHLKIPAQISKTQMQKAQEMAKKVFKSLECEGMARVDLFLDKDTNQFYLNEINTLPGFTSISMYPKMWEASGLSYSLLLTKLVNLAYKRKELREKLVRDFHGNK